MAFFLSWNHKSRTVLHSSARQLLAAFSGPRGSLSTYSLCSNKRPPDGWPRCEAHIWKLSLVLAQAFRSGRRVCVRYTHTLPGDPHIRPGAGQRSWDTGSLDWRQCVGLNPSGQSFGKFWDLSTQGYSYPIILPWISWQAPRCQACCKHLAYNPWNLLYLADAPILVHGWEMVFRA